NPVAAFRTRIRRVFERRGSVVIPAFALGRTQEVLYHLSALVDSGDLDPEDVFLDSPMAIKATELYDQAEAEHDHELKALLEKEIDVLGPDRFQRCRSVEQSKALNFRRKSTVIVASSGMANGGRVVHHLKRLLPDKRNAVIFVGYQAGGTRGRALVDGAESVAIHGEHIPVRADVEQLHGLSAHADRDGLIRWCRALPAPPRRILLNHGEDPARKALAAALAAADFPRSILPYVGDVYDW
ncbi:MAG: MBL fold metallo-hydrolase, partial [Acidobacteriota bacterium]|nr:MBL fold metallo-hydrolase [Acidobacteriota bacterium]